MKTKANKTDRKKKILVNSLLRIIRDSVKTGAFAQCCKPGPCSPKGR